MDNPFCHIELNTDSTDKAKKFYAALFAWKMKDEKMGPGMVYTMIAPGTGPGGGIQKKPMPEAPNAWLAYVLVDDVVKTIQKAKRLGAHIIVEYMPLPNMGSLGIFADPSGAVLGVWAPDKKVASKKVASKKVASKKPAARSNKKPTRKASKK
jgi:uncharacterized protein